MHGMGLSKLEEMPPGFRFYPTEEELVSFYLPQKLDGLRHDLDRVIPLLSVYDFNPWDLPQFAGEFCRGDPEQWFFFIPRQEKETRGGRPSRLTELGYWKATGSPGFVYSSSGNYNRVIGEKRTMVFYRGRAPNGVKTQWKMNEYSAIDGSEASSSTSTPPKLRKELSLCRVYIRSKCLRAFDRRPSGLIAINEGTNQFPAPNYGDSEPSRASDHHHHHQNPPLIIDDQRRNSSDDHRSSNSSGNHAVNQIQSMEIDHNRVDSSNSDPLWEWEQLNWF